MWGRFPGLLFRFYRAEAAGTLGVAARELAELHGPLALRAADVLWRIVRAPRPQRRPDQPHLGVAAFTEGVRLAEGVAQPEGAPDQLVQAVEDLVACGRAWQYRSVVGVMCSGWRFELESPRHNPAVTVAVCPPGEDWPDEPAHPLMRPLLALNRSWAAG